MDCRQQLEASESIPAVLLFPVACVYHHLQTKCSPDLEVDTAIFYWILLPYVAANKKWRKTLHSTL